MSQISAYWQNAILHHGLYPFTGVCSCSEDADIALVFDGDVEPLYTHAHLLTAASPVLKHVIEECSLEDGKLEVGGDDRNGWVFVLNALHPISAKSPIVAYVLSTPIFREKLGSIAHKYDFQSVLCRMEERICEQIRESAAGFRPFSSMPMPYQMMPVHSMYQSSIYSPGVGALNPNANALYTVLNLYGPTTINVYPGCPALPYSPYLPMAHGGYYPMPHGPLPQPPAPPPLTPNLQMPPVQASPPVPRHLPRKIRSLRRKSEPAPGVLRWESMLELLKLSENAIDMHLEKAWTMGTDAFLAKMRQNNAGKGLSRDERLAVRETSQLVWRLKERGNEKEALELATKFLYTLADL